VHEQSLMRDLMRKIETVALDEGGGRVVRIEVWLGALSHISPEHFREHFEQSSHGTLAAGADLAIAVGTDAGEDGAQDIRLQSVEVEVSPARP
jgi:hydrogenase nickel incorporation protein HypA/HybF